MEEEQVFTIPLRGVKETQRKKRAAKASRIVKEFLKKHLKVEKVKISSKLNEIIWEKGAEKPPSKVQVRVNKVSDELAEAEALE